MDIAITAGSDIMVRGLPGGPRTFRRLTVEDLGELQSSIPGDPRFVTVFELYRFAQTPVGALRVLQLSLGDATEATRLGLSVLQRVELARAIIGQSLVTGEETVEEAEAAKKKSPPDNAAATGQKNGA